MAADPEEASAVQRLAAGGPRTVGARVRARHVRRRQDIASGRRHGHRPADVLCAVSGFPGQSRSGATSARAARQNRSGLHQGLRRASARELPRHVRGEQSAHAPACPGISSSRSATGPGSRPSPSASRPGRSPAATARQASRAPSSMPSASISWRPPRKRWLRRARPRWRPPSSTATG